MSSSIERKKKESNKICLSENGHKPLQSNIFCFFQYWYDELKGVYSFSTSDPIYNFPQLAVDVSHSCSGCSLQFSYRGFFYFAFILVVSFYLGFSLIFLCKLQLLLTSLKHFNYIMLQSFNALCRCYFLQFQQEEGMIPAFTTGNSPQNLSNTDLE